MDLEGTQTIRILCYEEIIGQQKPFFRGKASLELSQSWLNDSQTHQCVPILDVSHYSTTAHVFTHETYHFHQLFYSVS